MLHAVKKQFALLKEPLVNVPNGEFADLRQRLCAIKTALKYTSSMLTSSNRIWVLQMQQQRQFSERFYDSYPSSQDDTYIVAKQFAEGSQALYDKFTRHIRKEGEAYLHIHKQVTLYIREIEELESSYSELSANKAETNRYQSKLDAMERSRRPMDESKKTRNLQKMDNHRESYRAMLKATIEKQKKIYAKHPIVFKAALTSYWISHEKHVTALVESLERTQTFAKASEAEMRELDITTYQPDIQSEMQMMSSKFGMSPSISTAAYLPAANPHSPATIIMEKDENAAKDDAEYKDAMSTPASGKNSVVIGSSIASAATTPVSVNTMDIATPKPTNTAGS